MNTVDPITLRSIRSKLEDKRIRTDSIIYKCEKIDKNNDNVIHTDDLEDVLYETLGPTTLTRREMKAVISSIEVPGGRSGSIEYKRLADVLDGPTSSSSNNNYNDTSRSNNYREETWRNIDDDDEFLDRTIPNGTMSRSDRPRVGRNGSIGEWLQSASCPAERKNFRKFIDAMERFERETGMKVTNTQDGLVVPMGPDLRCQVKFLLG